MHDQDVADEIRAHIAGKRYAEADALSRTLLSDPERHVTALALLARSALLRGDGREALRFSDRCLRLSPADPQLNLLHGLALFKSGAPGQAATHFEKAKELGLFNTETLGAMLQCYAALGDAARVLAVLDEFLRTSPLPESLINVVAGILAASMGAAAVGAVWRREPERLQGFAHVPQGLGNVFMEFSTAGDGRVFARAPAGECADGFFVQRRSGRFSTFQLDLPPMVRSQVIDARFTGADVPFLGGPASPPPSVAGHYEGKVWIFRHRIMQGFAANVTDPSEKAAVKVWDDFGRTRDVVAGKRIHDAGLAQKYGPYHGFSLKWPLAASDPLFVTVHACDARTGFPLLGSPVTVTDALRLDRARHLFSKWLRLAQEDPDAPLSRFPELCEPGAMRYLRTLRFG